jgi:hypothetical protein
MKFIDLTMLIQSLSSRFERDLNYLIRRLDRKLLDFI